MCRKNEDVEVPSWQYHVEEKEKHRRRLRQKQQKQRTKKGQR